MGNKLICLSLAFVALIPAFADGGVGPIGWWKLDETTGTTAADSSLSKNHGTYFGEPTPTTGQIDGGYLFDGTDDYIALPIGSVINTLGSATFSLWANYTRSGGNWQRLFDIGTGETVNMFLCPAIDGSNNGVMRFAITIGGSGSESRLSASEQLATGWHHVAVVIDEGAMDMEMYLDGVSIVTAATAVLPKDLGNTTQNWLGRSEYGADAYYSGSLDEFRIYDRALTAAEIVEVLGGGLTGITAGVPSPDNGATDVPRENDLSWTPGEMAETHDVYFGTSEEDVRNASVATPLGVLVSEGQDANTYDPGRLELGRTYYWRIDEVNDATLFKGAVWSFTVEPFSYPIANVTATASSTYNANTLASKTADGSGLDENDLHGDDLKTMWATEKNATGPAWIQYEFDTVYKLDRALVWNSNQGIESLIGIGVKDATVEVSLDGAAWTTLATVELAQGTGEPLAPQTFDLGGTAARYFKVTPLSNWGGVLNQYSLAEVRFYYIPVAAREPNPTDDANDVVPQVVLSWRAGREADSHQVYLDADEQAVAEGTAPVVTVDSPEYETSLMLDGTYYWKVVEVNDAEAIPSWDSPVWTFDTAHFIVVDDFESYTDDMTAGDAIFQSWIDGYEDDNNGSQVGYIDPPFAEQTSLYSGKQSMPMTYENTGGVAYSEATLSFDPAQDWTQHGITTLVLYFRGLSDNAPAPLYVKMNDKKVPFNNGATATTLPLWKQWNIALADTGANLKSVKSLTVGIEGSGAGKMFFDDIRLYAAAPEVVVPADPGTTGLVALYAMDGNVQDSSGKKQDGVLNGDASYEAGYSGQALLFNGINAYVDLPIGSLLSTLSDITITMWVNSTGTGGDWQRVFDFGTSTTNYMFLSSHQTATGPMTFGIRTTTSTETRVTAPARLPTGWHHVAISIDSATMGATLYLDGVVVGTNTVTVLPKDLGNTTQNYLGDSQWPDDAFFTGLLDEFRIYSRVLSEAEVRYLAGDR